MYDKPRLVFNAPDPERFLLHLRLAAAKVEYFCSRMRLRVSCMYRFARQAAAGRKLALNLRASMHGELREQFTEELISGIDGLLADMRSGAEMWAGSSPVTRFIVEPARRNFLENCEMLEDVVLRLKQPADAEAGSPEQDPPTARESDA